MLRARLVFVVVLLWLAAVTAARAQTRPLRTQDAEVIGAGRVIVALGLEVLRDVTYPASGLAGDLLRAPVLGVTAGLGAIVDVQVQGALHQRLAIQRRFEAPLSGGLVIAADRTSDMGALEVATKVRLLAERARRPAVGLRIATRLPTTSEEEGLGLDTTDFSASALFAKSMGAFRLAGSLGLGILGDATDGARQNDVVEYGVSAARTLSRSVQVTAEANGHVNIRRHGVPPGTDTAGQGRFGGRVRVGAGWLDAAVIVGLTPRDARVGIALGYTRAFDAFSVP